MSGLFVCLIHYPVLDRNGRVVTAAITSLDLHDIARSARTYGVQAMYVVHPVASQREFALRASESVAGVAPLLVYTSARASGGVSCAQLRAHLDSATSLPLMLMFGTGFGLAPVMRERADLVLNAIRGPGDYNHLSVRAAAGIILDRLVGRER